MLAPALPDMADDLNTSGFETYFMMSIFLLAYAIGPFVLAPLSEVYGRVVVLQSANMIFLLFNTVCGWSRTKEQMMLFRFLSGFGGAAPQAVRTLSPLPYDINTDNLRWALVFSVTAGELKNVELPRQSIVSPLFLALRLDP